MVCGASSWGSSVGNLGAARTVVQQYAAEVGAASGAGPGSLAVDIGSNDGSLLKAFKAIGYRVAGIDPAVAIANQATAENLRTTGLAFPRNAGLLRDILLDWFRKKKTID